MKPLKPKNKTHHLVLLSLLFAMAIVLTFVENMLPPLIPTIPGLKFGLSNIIVMYTLIFLGYQPALAIVLLKGLFAFGTRGAMAGAFSTFGGLFALCAMALVLFIFKKQATYLSISMIGAVCHNLGQFLMVLLFYGAAMWTLLPILILSGIVAGAITATSLRFLLPAFQSNHREDGGSQDAP